MSNFLERLIEEKNQLEDRCIKLGAFIESDRFQDIDAFHRHVLIVQHSSMKTYFLCLEQRLVLLNAADDGSNPPNGPGTPP